MKRTSTKKGMDRRKRTRDKSSSSRNRVKQIAPQKSRESCYACAKELTRDARALFVEEEVGRIFCSEGCITDYFSPEIAKLEREYFKRLAPHDLNDSERESYSHLRWVTLQEPDELWQEITPEGDHRYTFISEFLPGTKKIWCVCICLCLRGEPSFLYLAFPTRNGAMVDHFRKGERVEVVRTEGDEATAKDAGDGLANAWTEDEMIRAQLNQQRDPNDIPPEDYSLYQSCLEETLQVPDEVWSIPLAAKSGLKLYHFIRKYSDEKPGVWYLVVARETEDREQIEILDAFPTRQASLVDRYRVGTQEVGGPEAVSNRVIH